MWRLFCYVGIHSHITVTGSSGHRAFGRCDDCGRVGSYDGTSRLL